MLLIEPENELSKAFLSILQTIIYAVVLILTLAFFAIAGVFVFPLIAVAVILDKRVYGDKYANTNRDNSQD